MEGCVHGAYLQLWCRSRRWLQREGARSGGRKGVWLSPAALQVEHPVTTHRSQLTGAHPFSTHTLPACLRRTPPSSTACARPTRTAAAALRPSCCGASRSWASTRWVDPGWQRAGIAGGRLPACVLLLNCLQCCCCCCCCCWQMSADGRLVPCCALVALRPPDPPTRPPLQTDPNELTPEERSKFVRLDIDPGTWVSGWLERWVAGWMGTFGWVDGKHGHMLTPLHALLLPWAGGDEAALGGVQASSGWADGQAGSVQAPCARQRNGLCHWPLPLSCASPACAACCRCGHVAACARHQ